MTSQASGRHAPLALLIAAFAAVYIIWGSTYLAIDIAIESIPPLLMAGMRFVIAGILMYAWMRVMKKTPRPKQVHWRSAFIVGGLLLLGGNGLICLAELHVPSGLAALLVATVPMWMVVLDWLFSRGPRPSALITTGLGVGLLGVLVLVNPWEFAGESLHPLGATAILIACVSWAVGSLYARKASLPREVLLATGMEMIGGGILLLIAGTLRGEWPLVDFGAMTWQGVTAFVYLIVVGALMGYTAYIWLLQVVSPAAVSTYAFVNPVVAVFLGWLIANESIGPRTIVAAALIVGAVALITMRRAKSGAVAAEGGAELIETASRSEDDASVALEEEPLLCGSVAGGEEELDRN